LRIVGSTAAIRGALLAMAALAVVALVAATPAVAAGPPFPDPVVDQAVYDTAGVFAPGTVEEAERRIDTIENRTGAEVVVYSQVVDYGVTEDEAKTHARALMDQWGVGRKGFDDGLVILFDLDPSLVHGQVQLYAGPGYRAAFLSNQERQAIFDDQMLPLLRVGDLDAALTVGLSAVDANATPEHAARLQGARQLDAVVGLVGGPVVFLLIAGWGILSWWRFGRDPVYLDSPSIHMPAPPPELTAATGALLRDGRVTRRALTTAVVDLASRGVLSFREEEHWLGLQHKVGIETLVRSADPVTEAHRALNSRRPMSPAERFVLDKVRSIADEGYIEPSKILELGKHVTRFGEKLEGHAVRQGWFAESPAKVTQRWITRGLLVGGAGVALLVLGFNAPSNGLLLVGVAGIAGGLVLLALARAMPAVTISGAMTRSWLSAYRRTLAKTMAQARSMQQVVDEAGLAWLDTPDQAVVWGLALGLEQEVEEVLDRTMDDVRQSRAATNAWLPAWYHGDSGGAVGAAGGGPSGLFSSGSLPNFGGMVGALSTIGNSPGSSGGGSGGGFGGGGSGGGGGGAGGGF
jgi:uncharacterized membrane protein YgcG